MTQAPHGRSAPEVPTLPAAVLAYEERSSLEMVPLLRVLAAVGICYGAVLIAIACVDAPRFYGYWTSRRLPAFNVWISKAFFLWKLGGGLGGVILVAGALRLMKLRERNRRLFVIGCGTILAANALGWSCYFLNVLLTGMREHPLNYVHNAFDAIQELLIPLLLALLITCRSIRRAFP